MIAFALAPRGVGGAAPEAVSASPLYGFTAFPYDLSQEAVERVHEIIAPASNLYAIHLDSGCVPWAEALSGASFPSWMETDWTEVKSRIPSGHTVYVAVTPTTNDRQSMAAQCGVAEGVPGEIPDGFAEAAYDDARVVGAYVAYVRRVLETFEPRFVNLAIEISELSLGAPELWPSFETLYLRTLAELRASHPEVRFGLEVVLQSLLLPRVGVQLRAAVDASDYLGLSFYPYGSEYGEATGAPALPPPPEQWREPLAFVRGYTDKPLAIAETGYTTRDVTLPVRSDFSLHFPGDEATQAAFVRDLVEIARRDEYLFVVWFVPVDYPALMEDLAAPPDHAGWIWAYAGLWSGPDRPKPAWEEWLAFSR